MNKEIFIKKRSGKLETFNADKINKIIQWATENIKGVSFEEVAMNAHLSFFDGMTSNDIHSMLIEAASNLISEDSTSARRVAMRLGSDESQSRERSSRLRNNAALCSRCPSWCSLASVKKWTKYCICFSRSASQVLPEARA